MVLSSRESEDEPQFGDSQKTIARSGTPSPAHVVRDPTDLMEFHGRCCGCQPTCCGRPCCKKRSAPSPSRDLRGHGTSCCLMSLALVLAYIDTTNVGKRLMISNTFSTVS